MTVCCISPQSKHHLIRYESSVPWQKWTSAIQNFIQRWKNTATSFGKNWDMKSGNGIYTCLISIRCNWCWSLVKTMMACYVVIILWITPAGPYFGWQDGMPQASWANVGVSIHSLTKVKRGSQMIRPMPLTRRFSTFQGLEIQALYWYISMVIDPWVHDKRLTNQSLLSS